ncbi:MAG: hypothetical protein ACI9KE_006727 [Polyangiales bacterium]|jgi:hypothetical protein
MVREAVLSLAAQPVAEDVIADAVGRARLSAVPTGGASLREFIALHLHEAVTSTLGEDAADALLQTLGPIARKIPTLVPARLSPAPPSVHERRTSTPTLTPTVLLATSDVHRANLLDSALKDVRVTMVHDVVALLDIVQAIPYMQAVVVLDCLSPSVHPATLVTVAPEMVAGTEFVLWESGDATGERWMLADRTDSWVRCPKGAPIDQVAKAIRALMFL